MGDFHRNKGTGGRGRGRREGIQKRKRCDVKGNGGWERRGYGEGRTDM